MRRKEEASSSPQTTEARNERQASSHALQKRLRLSRLELPQRAIQTAPLDHLAMRAPLRDLSVVGTRSFRVAIVLTNGHAIVVLPATSTLSAA